MLDSLNARFARPDCLEFVAGAGGLPLARVTTQQCRGEVYLHGAQVTSWQPSGQSEVLWLSPTSQFAAGRAIRGGVPICWPWFGDDPTAAGRPAHGFARICSFEMSRVDWTEAGDCELELSLAPSPRSRELWAEDFELSLTVRFGRELDLQLRMANRSASAVTHSAALHTYLRVSDVHQVGIVGLAGGDYLDKVRGSKRCRQAEEPKIEGEVDRVYLRTTAECRVIDAGLARELALAKTGSRTTVLWNPGIERARGMADLDLAGFHNMLCIEAANTADDLIELEPGEEHCLGTRLRVF